MKICLPFYENPNYIPYKENNYEDSSFVVKMTSGFFIGDMITISDDVLDNNNFFDKKSFNFIKKTSIVLSENNEKTMCNVMEKVTR